MTAKKKKRTPEQRAQYEKMMAAKAAKKAARAAASEPLSEPAPRAPRVPAPSEGEDGGTTERPQDSPAPSEPAKASEPAPTPEPPTAEPAPKSEDSGDLYGDETDADDTHAALRKKIQLGTPVYLDPCLEVAGLVSLALRETVGFDFAKHKIRSRVIAADGRARSHVVRADTALGETLAQLVAAGMPEFTGGKHPLAPALLTSAALLMLVGNHVAKPYIAAFVLDLMRSRAPQEQQAPQPQTEDERIKVEPHAEAETEAQPWVFNGFEKNEFDDE